MTPETFKATIRAVVKEKGKLSSFGEAKLSALARSYSIRKIDLAEAITGLQSLFADNYEVDRHDYAEIEKRLERY